MAFARAPLTLTFLRITEVCQKQESVHESVITELDHFEPKTKPAMP